MLQLYELPGVCQKPSPTECTFQSQSAFSLTGEPLQVCNACELLVQPGTIDKPAVLDQNTFFEMLSALGHRLGDQLLGSFECISNPLSGFFVPVPARLHKDDCQALRNSDLENSSCRSRSACSSGRWQPFLLRRAAGVKIDGFRLLSRSDASPNPPPTPGRPLLGHPEVRGLPERFRFRVVCQ